MINRYNTNETYPTNRIRKNHKNSKKQHDTCTHKNNSSRESRVTEIGRKQEPHAPGVMQERIKIISSLPLSEDFGGSHTRPRHHLSSLYVCARDSAVRPPTSSKARLKSAALQEYELGGMEKRCFREKPLAREGRSCAVILN